MEPQQPGLIAAFSSGCVDSALERLRSGSVAHHGNRPDAGLHPATSDQGEPNRALLRFDAPSMCPQDKTRNQRLERSTQSGA
jgi:hypothetical protein